MNKKERMDIYASFQREGFNISPPENRIVFLHKYDSRTTPPGYLREFDKKVVESFPDHHLLERKTLNHAGDVLYTLVEKEKS